MSKAPKQTPDKNPNPSSRKKYLLIGGLFVLCAVLLKRDAH